MNIDSASVFQEDGSVDWKKFIKDPPGHFTELRDAKILTLDTNNVYTLNVQGCTVPIISRIGPVYFRTIKHARDFFKARGVPDARLLYLIEFPLQTA